LGGASSVEPSAIVVRYGAGRRVTVTAVELTVTCSSAAAPSGWFPELTAWKRMTVVPGETP
jgi:hypothetical protein